MKDLESYGKKIVDYINKYYNEIDIEEYLKKEILCISKENRKHLIDIIEFYNHLRVCSNRKKSTLYKNIVKEITTPSEVLTTLGALQLQILLYSNKLENKITFYRQARAKEINQVLNNYFETFDLTNCINLLKLFKADIKCLESLSEK